MYISIFIYTYAYIHAAVQQCALRSLAAAAVCVHVCVWVCACICDTALSARAQPSLYKERGRGERGSCRHVEVAIKCGGSLNVWEHIAGQHVKCEKEAEGWERGRGLRESKRPKWKKTTEKGWQQQRREDETNSSVKSLHSRSLWIDSSHTRW